MEDSLDFIRENRDQAPLDYVECSVLSGNEADAATYLIEILEGEATRGLALERVQHYADMDILPPVTTRINAALRKLTEQPEVAAAILKWGRIEDIPMPPALR